MLSIIVPCFNEEKLVEKSISEIVKAISLIKLKKSLNIFKPDIFFPAGGTYKIYGKFYKLNNLIAQPSFKSICNTNIKNIYKSLVCKITDM